MGEMAVEKTMTAFLDVLNTPENYSTLTTKIDDKYKGQSWQANYIGNVSNSSGNISGQGKEDAQVVEGLLGSGLTLTVDNVTKNITVMIKREDLDDNERTGDAYEATYWWSTARGKGCEMAIYMTPNNLDKIPDEGEYNGDKGDNWAEVYIAVSTCTNDGQINDDGTTNLTSDWYQIGDIYAGVADIVTYDGDDGTGSFVTDRWVSLEKTYKVTENYSYTIQANQTLRNIIQTTVDKDACDEFTRLLNLAEAEIKIIDANSDYFNVDAYQKPIATLREVAAKANAMNVVENSTQRSSLIPILKELENATYPFLDFISSES